MGRSRSRRPVRGSEDSPRARPVRPDPDAGDSARAEFCDDSGRPESCADSARAESFRSPAALPGTERDFTSSPFCGGAFRGPQDLATLGRPGRARGPSRGTTRSSRAVCTKRAKKSSSYPKPHRRHRLHTPAAPAWEARPRTRRPIQTECRTLLGRSSCRASFSGKTVERSLSLPRARPLR